MKNTLPAASVLAAALLLCACSPQAPTTQSPRPVRVTEINYDSVRETHRYVGSVQSRHEVEQAFRVAGKVIQRKVDVGQRVREGEILAVLDDSDYRLAEQAAQQQWKVAVEQMRFAQSDHQRLQALKADGSVSAADDERASTLAQTAQATAQAEARKLEIARNTLEYTILRATRSGVVTAVRVEVGQVVAQGQPAVSIADPGEPEIVVDVPEDHLASFNDAHFVVSLASAPDNSFEAVIRELSPQAASQTRTFRARLKPKTLLALPLGATATVMAERVTTGLSVAVVPATALTQQAGNPVVWVVTPTGKDHAGNAEPVPVQVWGYRKNEVLISGPQAGALVVTAGVQKMASGLSVSLPDSAIVHSTSTQQASR
ncbi:efflux RND transporter periplasmic adaptor subunit [Pseudomonas sp. NBRC 111124]|uniref:efflux RND transporter periplasmic adaptor subunit n=1 Tax=Pseudomonas sp. NBRC 111124 TaxID=1661039 RepID=UPI000760F5DC|nr:efflux RND transporter periplasmic adaptor subunit [Pseudomonas sp. NBRC 111124]